MGDDRRRGSGPAGDEAERERRLQREREDAAPEEHDSAAGPGYTARPGEDDPEPPEPGSRKG